MLCPISNSVGFKLTYSLALLLKTHCQGVVDNGVQPAEQPLFVVVQCSFANCLRGALWNSYTSSGLLN